MSRALIVGAGFAGLSAAIELAAAGHEVTVLERGARVGGKAGVLEAGEFRWPTGPTLLTMPEVLDQALGRAGLRLADTVELTPLAPLCRYRFASGAVLDHVADPERMAEQLRALWPADAAAWQALAKRASRLFEGPGRTFLEDPVEHPAQLLLRLSRHGLAAAGARGSLSDLARRQLRSPELRQLLERFATYAGGSPLHTPAMLSMVLHVEQRGDAVHPRGGMHAVARQLAHAAERLGVRLELNHDVRAVLRRPGGWQLDGLEADALILATDPLGIADRFEDASIRRELARSGQVPRSLSGVALLLGLRGETPGLALHNVFFPADTHAEFRELFERGELGADPTIYVCAPSLVDPTCAPFGHEALFVLVNAPPRLEFDVARELPRIRERVLRRLRALDPGIGERIVAEHVVDPRTLARTGTPDGAIYGAAPHGVMALLNRPGPRVRAAAGLYVAGGAVQPGGGVPLAVLSGRHAATLVQRDLQRSGREARP